MGPGDGIASALFVSSRHATSKQRARRGVVSSEWRICMKIERMHPLFESRDFLGSCYIPKEFLARTEKRDRIAATLEEKKSKENSRVLDLPIDPQMLIDAVIAGDRHIVAPSLV